MSILLLLSAIFIGISAFCWAMLFINFMQSISADTDGIEEPSSTGRLSLSLRMTLPLVKFFRPLASNESFASRCDYLNMRLAMAGVSDVINGRDFLALRFANIFIGVIVFVIFHYLGQGLMGFMLGLLLSIAPGMWLNNTIKRRHTEIMRALPNLLDLLTLSVEAGKDFISSLRDILAKRKHDAIYEEFSRTFNEIQLGRKRSEALKNLSLRVNHADLSSVLNAIIQAEELGVSIGELLKIQGDMLRNKRFTMAEKLANEAPVKIIIPIVLFIFPAVLIILVGPIVMQAVNMF